jgi:hypothetical protein
LAYGALTIMDAVNKGITDRKWITQNAYAPLFIHNYCVYERVKNSSSANACGQGVFFETALDVLRDSGVCRISEFNPADCRVLPGSAIRSTAQDMRGQLQVIARERLSDRDMIKNKMQDYTIARIRSCILENKPVSFAMFPTTSFQQLKQRLWIPLPTEKKTEAHAMLITGFDDVNREFEVMNSWNNGNWGDPAHPGFCRIRYQDLLDSAYFIYAYSFTLAAPVKPKDTLAFRGAFDFQELVPVGEVNDRPGQDVDSVTYNASVSGYWYYTFGSDTTAYAGAGNYVSRKGDMKRGDLFRLVVKDVTKNTFVYLLSIRPDSTANILFPKYIGDPDTSAETTSVIPLIPDAATQFYIPGTHGEVLVASQVGEDRLIILYSNRQLQDSVLISVRDQLASNTGLPASENIQQALGDKLIPPGDIIYEPGRMEFRASTTGEGYIVPLVLNLSIKRQE